MLEAHCVMTSHRLRSYTQQLHESHEAIGMKACVMQQDAVAHECQDAHEQGSLL